jgi:hypothetical protein
VHRASPAKNSCANASWQLPLQPCLKNPASSSTMATTTSSEDHGGDGLQRYFFRRAALASWTGKRSGIGSQRRALRLARACAKAPLARRERVVHGGMPATSSATRIYGLPTRRRYRALRQELAHGGSPREVAGDVNRGVAGLGGRRPRRGRSCPRRSSTSRASWSSPSEALRSKTGQERRQAPAAKRTDDGEAGRRRILGSPELQRNGTMAAAKEGKHGDGRNPRRAARREEAK